MLTTYGVVYVIQTTPHKAKHVMHYFIYLAFWICKTSTYTIDLFGEVEVSRLRRGLMSDVVGILSHYLNAHAQDCGMEPSDNSTMSSVEFKKALTNEVSWCCNIP